MAARAQYGAMTENAALRQAAAEAQQARGEAEGRAIRHEHEARELMTTMLVTYRDSDGTNPFKDEEVWRPMVEALVAAGCETLQDVGHLSSGEVTGLSDENLAKLQGDPRVLAHTRKQEL